jgi:hypothetical protein
MITFSGWPVAADWSDGAPVGAPGAQAAALRTSANAAIASKTLFMADSFFLSCV